MPPPPIAAVRRRLDGDRGSDPECIALMDRLGFDKFHVAGHDRGSYAAFRLALDHPSRVLKLAILDGVPILESLERCGARFASTWWHWFFYAQPDKPERAIFADPKAWYGGSVESMGQENFEDFQAAIHDPETIIGMLGDYRAGIALDQLHDKEDREAGRRIQCPLHVIWSLKDDSNSSTAM